jgi:hypothetical protein
MVMRRTALIVAVGSLAATLLGTPESNAADTSCWCNPVHPAVFETRIHIRCNAATGGDECGYRYPKFKYFAFPTSKPIYKDMWLLFVAYGSSAPNDRPTRPVRIYFDPNDTSGQAWGCLASDCRTIAWVEGG